MNGLCVDCRFEFSECMSNGGNFESESLEEWTVLKCSKYKEKNIYFWQVKTTNDKCEYHIDKCKETCEILGKCDYDNCPIRLDG